MNISYHRKVTIAICLLAALSFGVHFAWFGQPNMTVFDEVHFGKFISAYFTHEYYFDIHPPLGKLILAGWGWLWGFQPGFSFASIGDVFPDRTYLALRFLPTLAGSLLPLVIYGLARQLKMSQTASLLAGTLVALDNALIVQSRLILLDSFLLLFGFSAIWCYLRWRNKPSAISHWLLALSGLLAGMSMAIKWTGISFLALIVILEAIRLFRSHQRHSISYKLSAISCLVILPFLVYYSAFMIHFKLLSKSGPGDAFMTQAFQDGQLSSPQKFAELNVQMYQSNQRLTATHPYASAWYTWPFDTRAIFYWVKDTARIYLLGNPLIWWASTTAVFILFLNVLLSGLRSINSVVAILGGAWLLNMLPFVGITRVMFLYHYFTALIWAILILAYLVDQSKRPARPAVVITVLAVAAFVFFAPLTYGLPMTERAYHLRTWFSSWI